MSPSHSDAMLTWCNDSQLWNKQLRFLRLEGGTGAVKHGRQPVYGLRLVFGLIMSLSSSYAVRYSSPDSGIPPGLDFVHSRFIYLLLHFLTGPCKVPEAC